MSDHVLGIDLGTLNSCVAVVEDGRAVVLSDESHTTIPSCVSIQGSKELVGHAARRQALTDPQNTLIAVKRFLGHSFESRQVQTAIERSAFPIRPSPLGGVMLEAGGRELTPVQVSARVLQHIREIAERSLGTPVSKAVISVPAHFTDVQRKATKLAAEYAGLEVLRLVNEPTAAAFAYGYRKGDDLRLAVYDLGGGTFDITVMSAAGDRFEVEATDGDPFLGGEDLDHTVAEWLADQIEGCDLRADSAVMLRLREAAERAKIELGERAETRIELPCLMRRPDGNWLDFAYTLEASKLQELAQPLIERTLALCDSCLSAAGLERIDVDEVLMVGGQSRMPAIRDAVRDFFGTEPRRDINPDEVVAMGAALYGYSIAAGDVQQAEERAAEDAYAVALHGTQIARKLLSRVEQGRERDRDREGIAPTDPLRELLREGEDADLPTEGSLPQAINQLRDDLSQLSQEADAVIKRVVDEVQKQPCEPTVDKLTVDRLQEALAAAELASERAQKHSRKAEQHASMRKVELVDVTSHPLGIASAGGVFSVLIDRNVPIPAEAARCFTTSQDDQTEVEIRVFQGTATHVEETQALGAFVLEGIAPAPRMQRRVDVRFRVDESGILSVAARDAESGVSQTVRIENPLELQQTEPQPEAAEPA